MPELDLRDIVPLGDFEQWACHPMSTITFEYLATGALDEHTLRRNQSASQQTLRRFRGIRRSICRAGGSPGQLCRRLGDCPRRPLGRGTPLHRG